MPGSLLDTNAADSQVETNIDVSLAADSGWNVTATVDGRVVAARHCNDWHRVERLCLQLSGERNDDLKIQDKERRRP